MAGREQGEFELVLGNKQLFSVLFLVIILLGIFFAMGYLAGRSGPTPAAKETVSRSTPSPPQVRAGPPVVREARNDPAPPATEKPAAPARKEAPKETPQETPASPPDGKYLQAAALPKTPADAMAKLFRRDGQSAHVAPAPGKSKSDEPMFRVLVGPFSDNTEIAKAREYLKEKGIEKPIPRTYPDARSN